jgi:hypothetical protein
MHYRLFCGRDPVQEGIEQTDGSWQLTRLIEHIAQCAQCKQFTNQVKASIWAQLFETEEEENE